MDDLDLDRAQAITAAVLTTARERDLKPIAVAVLDARGALKTFAAEDGTSLRRAEIAQGKAHGALAVGLGSRSIHKRAREQPYFIAAVGQAIGGALIPVPGGVLVRAGDAVVGAVGVSGDASDNDEALAVDAIEAAGFVADPGSD